MSHCLLNTSISPVLYRSLTLKPTHHRSSPTACLNAHMRTSISPVLHRSLTLKPTHCRSSPTACLNAHMHGPYSKQNPPLEEKWKLMVEKTNREPVVLLGGIGCKGYDVEGREYLDMISGISVNVLGHRIPCADHVISAHRQQFDPQSELAKRLVASTFADRAFFCHSGTQANSVAIKFSSKFQRYTHPDAMHPPMDLIAFRNSFHGITMAACALTSKELYIPPFKYVNYGVTFLEYNNVQAAVEMIKSGKIAAVFVEPIQGEGGIYSATKEFLQSLRTACDNAGCLLVFDEIQCGLGRTGHLWAHEAYGVFPDIMTLGESLAGLPIGVVLVNERVASFINLGDHIGNYESGPLLCTAGIVLDKVSNPSFLASVSEKGQYFKDLLVEKLGGNSHVRQIRGLGLIIGIELDVSASSFVDACRKRGLLIMTAGTGNIVRIGPPLIISKQELDLAIRIMTNCLPVLDQASNK